MNTHTIKTERLKIFTSLLGVATFLISLNSLAQEARSVWEPEPKVITSGDLFAPPSDALVLMDGSNLDEWESKKEGNLTWKLEDGGMVVDPSKGRGSIQTKRSFGDCQLHIEWKSPAVIEGEGIHRGNSGVYLQSKYEVQILDSYNNKTYVNGQAGSIYKQYIPLVNASRPPGEWQSFDIVFNAPTFEGNGELNTPGYITVFHNGVLVQNHVELFGDTVSRGKQFYTKHGKLPISLQDHGSAVGYRNIWIREL